MSDISKLISNWNASFTKGTDFDSWGQVVEAVDEYDMLSKQLLKEASPDSIIFSEKQKKTLLKISGSLKLRKEAINNPNSANGISLEDMKKVQKTLADIMSSNQKEFPIHVPASTTRPPKVKKGFDLELDDSENEDEEFEDEDDDEDEHHHKSSISKTGGEGTLKGSLLRMIPPEAGATRLTVAIDKIGFKDALVYIDPFIVISVKDVSGVAVTAVQSTPTSIKKEDPYVLFGVDVEIQKYIEKLPKGSAIFFEFKHYKPKKRITSTKCFAFLEMDEIKEGPMVVELYKKPTDYKRKKLNLLTNKPLYLHLFLTLHTD
ncbi:axin interactor, dorsalization-associated protein-like [Antedon mediterranea]|uniref:axin interactor, dorsalization-associated protein-like n=1 Tax=Antedon mediterranea TaxID=105859 RepID=UPI003AF9EE69